MEAVPETESIYQIYLRNFTQEGTFAAAIAHLDRIKAMGFSWLYLTPIHPIGKEDRKGSLGSPYAISDYRAVNPELGTMEDFKQFLDAAHQRGFKVMIDVVYNHTSPDSVLAREHPEWFFHGSSGSPEQDKAERHERMHAHGSLPKPGRKCEDWSDVVDFDYGTSPELWIELISILNFWKSAGVDGFRCDVASLVPVDFWKQARQRVNQYDPGLRKERFPVLWLAESVHPRFLKEMRDRGFGAWSEPELHAAFDLTYDYDGWERLEKVWSGEKPLSYYLEYLYTQETLYPKTARKIRYLENHDQERAADRFASKALLKNWTVLYQLLPGVTFVYMGQEMAIKHRPSLFEKEPVAWESADPEFYEFFQRVFSASQRIKAKAQQYAAKNAAQFAWRELTPDVILVERRADASAVVSAGASKGAPDFCALLNFSGSAQQVSLPYPIKGYDMISGAAVSLAGNVTAGLEPLLVSAGKL